MRGGISCVAAEFGRATGMAGAVFEVGARSVAIFAVWPKVAMTLGTAHVFTAPLQGLVDPDGDPTALSVAHFAIVVVLDHNWPPDASRQSDGSPCLSDEYHPAGVSQQARYAESSSSEGGGMREVACQPIPRTQPPLGLERHGDDLLHQLPARGVADDGSAVRALG